MLRTFLSVLKRETERSGELDVVARRRYARRNVDRCVAVVGDKMYPVEDWSLGGVKIQGDGRLFTDEQQIDLTMKFKLRDEVIDIPHRGRVVRKTKENIAFEFLPLPVKMRGLFQQVVDDYVTRQFADSQMA
jgi:hypothetical protein